VEEIGIFLICAVLGYATVRLSILLKHKLHGSFDEVLPYIIILGSVVLYVGYGLAQFVARFALSVEWPGILSFTYPDKGLLSLMSAEDVNAMFSSLIVAFIVAKIIDLFAVWLYARMTKKLSFKQIFLSPRLTASRYEKYLLSRIIAKDGDDFQKLQFDAVRRRQYLLVTLTNQRIYYGMSTFEARHPQLVSSHGDFRQLQIIPLLSGYRDNDKRKVHLTDTHPPTFRRKTTTQKARLGPSLIEIPYAKIVTMQYVDISFLLKNAIKTSDFMASLKAQSSEKGEGTPLLNLT